MNRFSLFCFFWCRTIYNWWRQRNHKRMTKDDQHLHMAWEEDYHLQSTDAFDLLDEYLEMSMNH